MCPAPQYAVPVTKYDRNGYKARNRQLILMSESAVVVEDGKLKQRIDYSALKGEEGEIIRAHKKLIINNSHSICFICRDFCKLSE